MSESLAIWLFPALGYLIGSFPTGVVFSKFRFGIDVREMGSGNIGATNVTRNFGWFAGLVVLVSDFLKAWIPLTWIQKYDPESPWLLCLVGVSVVLGHCYSVFLRFGGGKGVASSLGCLTAVMPFAALLSGLTYVLGLSVTRISAVGSLMGVAVASGYAAFYEPVEAFRWMVWLVSLIITVRHKDNLVRLYGDIRGDSGQKQTRAPQSSPGKSR